MAHIYPICHNNKKGVSMIELIAYIALYGLVTSVLASLTYTIIITARKVNRQAVLNRASVIMYTDILAQTISLNPDHISDITKTADGNTISITLQKKYKYTDDGDRVEITATDTEYASKPNAITYSYTKETDYIGVRYSYLNGTYVDSKIDLEYNIYISMKDSDEIDGVFSVVKSSSFNKSVIFNGFLNFDSRQLEFNFVVPVFTVSDD